MRLYSSTNPSTTMRILSRISKYWRSTAEMPFLLRILCGGAMVVCPFFLVALIIPGSDVEVDGVSMTYSQFWASGNAPALAAALALGTIGSWGVAARIRAARWLLVLMPIAPAFVLACGYRQLLPWDSLVGAALTSVGVWLCLFGLESVRAFLEGEAKGRRTT
jgi:hypothetical protein